MKKVLQRFGLTPGNSIVIGSGILGALGIRESKDIDILINQEVYDSLKKSDKFIVSENPGLKILTKGPFEIGTTWKVLGKSYGFEDFLNNSTIIDGVRYITLNFLLKAKKSWLHQKDVRQKDIEDVKLIEKYMFQLNQPRSS